MAYEATKTYGITIVIIVAIILLVGWKYFGWFQTTSKIKKDGDSCIVKDSTGSEINGTYKNGICIPVAIGPRNPVSSNQRNETIYNQ